MHTCHTWTSTWTCPVHKSLSNHTASSRQILSKSARSARCAGKVPQSSSPSSDEQQTAAWEAVAHTILKNNPEAQASLRRVAEAQGHVSAIMAAQAELAAATLEAQAASPAENAALERDQAARASIRAADVQVSDAERAVAEAELTFFEAQLARRELNRVAQKDADRVESGKAATLAAGVGGLACLPYTAYLAGTVESAILSIAGVVLSCALFGVVYRYARRDNTLDNHLKGGALAAFGLVRGIAVADTLQSAASAKGISALSFSPAALEAVIGPSALAAGESMLVFGFAAAVLEAALQRGTISEISSDRSAEL